MASKTKIVIGEFGSPAELMAAANKLRESQFGNFDCHSPFPIHGMDDAMGVKRSKLGFIVGTFAAIGLTVAIILQWYASVKAYPLVISGKPFWSYQAYLPVTFALGVLLAAFSALIGMMAMNKLPRWNHPLFESDNFKKVTDDGFFVTIEVDDTGSAESFLKEIGADNIEVVE